MSSRFWWGSETTAASIAGVGNEYCLAGSVTSRRNCVRSDKCTGGRENVMMQRFTTYHKVKL